MTKINYQIYKSIYSDINNGWIWITKEEFANRRVVRIKSETGTVFCESLFTDPGYIRIYKNNSTIKEDQFVDNSKYEKKELNKTIDAIVINNWYRNKLGIGYNQESAYLDIIIVDNLITRLRTCFQHPQIVIRISIYIGFISIILGFCRLVFAVIPYLPKLIK